MESHFLLPLAKLLDWFSVLAAVATLGCATQVAFADSDPSAPATPIRFPSVSSITWRSLPYWVLSLILALLQVFVGRPLPSPADLTARGRFYYLLTFTSFGTAFALYYLARLSARFY